jgi:hypothetical protein
LLAVALLLSLTTGAFGASPELGDQVYHSLRYTDDFSYLADPAKSTDPWDKLKYIPIGDGKYGTSYLSLGGEVRERFESYLNPNFGLKAPPKNAYLLHRLLLNIDAHVTDYIRIFAQFGEFDRLGERGITSTTDIDHLELTQGFVDLRLPSPLGDAPVVRVGREELLFGCQRLIAVREGPNVRRTFDGARITDHWGDATIDLLLVRPVSNAIGVLDDLTNMKQLLWGGYLTVPLGAVLKADLYELNYENGSAKFRGLTGVEQRQTFGVRLFGRTDGFDWNGEAAVQSGTYRNQGIHAEMLAAIAGYTFRDVIGSLGSGSSQITPAATAGMARSVHSTRCSRGCRISPRRRCWCPRTSVTCGRFCRSGRCRMCWRHSVGIRCGGFRIPTGCMAAPWWNMPTPTRSPGRGSAPSCRPMCDGGSIGIWRWAPSPPNSCRGRPCRKRWARTSRSSLCLRHTVS